VIHNGVDTNLFRDASSADMRRSRGIADDVVLVGAVGNLRPAKDYATLIRAAARVPAHERIQFAIIGEPAEPLYGELMRLRDELNLTDRVFFWGFQENIPA